MSSSTVRQKIPILLLKTKSTPGDGYEEIFSRPQDGLNFEPAFVPVLEHRFDHDGMSKVETTLKSKSIGRNLGATYGGLIFTSQRAVEAFTKIVQDGEGKTSLSNAYFHDSWCSWDVSGHDKQWPHLCDVPVYSVGPATTRALKAIPSDPPFQVFGEHTGNGDNLAVFILEHYDGWYSDRADGNPALLFLVGEQRRDIIPKTLADPQLPEEKRIAVDEVVVYGTGVMESFPDDLERCLRETQDREMVWIVVFSPTGCDAMLRGLSMLDEKTGQAKPKDPSRTRFIATIGPTTRNYLKRTFDFEPDVCSEKPSPEGVLEGIRRYMSHV